MPNPTIARMETLHATLQGPYLAITSSATPAAAGFFQAGGICDWAFIEEGLRTGEGLLAAISRRLDRKASLARLIMLDRGPGQFTGLRAGIGITQGLAMGWGVPVLSIDSASIMAWSAWEIIKEARFATDGRTHGAYQANLPSPMQVITVRDARLGAFYVAEFSSIPELLEAQADSVQTLSLEQLTSIVSARRASIACGGELVLVSDESSQKRLLETNAFDETAKADVTWLRPGAIDLVGALARLGIERLKRGAKPLQAEQLEAYYVRNDVAMDLSAQRAYRRAQGEQSRIT